MMSFGLSEEERQIVGVVREWVDAEVRPRAHDLEADNTYPDELISQMKDLGIFGLTIPSEYGGTGASKACYALVTEEVSRGWMSLAGTFGGHSVVAGLILEFGTEHQKASYLPRMATGSIRAAMALTEPGGGSDLQAMTTTARDDGGRYLLSGTKTWITNAQRAALTAVLCKTNPDAQPPHAGMSILLVEMERPGVNVSEGLPKLGYKGIESCSIHFEDAEIPKSALLGQDEGSGFVQMMQGLELGRIQVAARAVGVARAAFEESLAYAQDRHSFGKPIWRHQSIGNYLADMATNIEAARLLVLNAAHRLDSGLRSDLEAGMAKLFSSEMAMDVTVNAMRIHGGYGYSTEFDIERYFRDAPLMIIGEGTNEIQRNVIARQLISRKGR